MSDLSMAQITAALSPAEREEVFEDVDMDALLNDWNFWGRPQQLRLIRETEWTLALLLAGRGFGKTRSGCEWVRHKAMNMPGSRGALVARTAADVRDVLVNGESGILNIGPPSERPEWFPSNRRLVWPNGAEALCFSSEAPDSLRGVQFHWSLADEVAAWQYIPDDSGLTSWDNLNFATRLAYVQGSTVIEPAIAAMTTPKRTPFLRQVLDEMEKKRKGSTLLIRGSTYDNAANLAESFMSAVTGLYEGTAIGRQELEGLMLDDVEGALWTTNMLDATRVNIAPILPLRVVGVDPSVAEFPNDECGIVVIASTAERELYKRQAYVLEDASILGSPDTWAQRVVATAKKWDAPVIAENNQGGDLVRNAIHAVDPTVKVFTVWSKQGKKLRAEPIVMTYEQKRVHHIGYFPELEDQLTTWDPERDRKSPDRLDALVHALTAVLIKQPEGLYTGRLVAKSPAARRLPSTRGSQRAGRVFTPGRRAS